MEDLNKEVGKKLQICRENSKVTQLEMAEYAGLSKNYLSALERGNHKANVNTLLAYCKRLSVTPNQILGFSEEKNINPELLSLIKEMTEDKQKQLINIIKAIE